jgi:hypothetical protein
MKRVSRHNAADDQLAPLERWPAHITRLLLDQYCCSGAADADNRALVQRIASLSRCMHTVIRSAYRHERCAKLACRAWIRPYEEYYALGGGKVINCARCATETEFTICVSKKDTVFRRGWDQAAKAVWWTKLRRIMI